MFFAILCLFSIQLSTVLCFSYSKPIPEKISKELCFRHPWVLNDCNWCSCTTSKRYSCTARDCTFGVDMAKHFKENIQQLNIGMEGHGSWRSENGSICEPNVHYTKDNIVCVCSEDGTWPNPTCDNTFNLLFSVKLTHLAFPNNNTKCDPNELYLIGCNVCFCKKSGFIETQSCTNRTCTKDDPALLANKGDIIPTNITRKSMAQFQNINIECNPDQHYKLGCRSCVCNNDNKLICGQCLTEKVLTKSKIVCYGHHQYIFADQCNICYCGDGNFAFCTVKKCLVEKQGLKIEKKIGNAIFDINYVEPPINDKDCVVGTIFKKDCNVCFCRNIAGVKVIDCKMQDCEDKKNPLKSITSSCVPKTYYEHGCLICHCVEFDNDTWQRCVVKKECDTKNTAITELEKEIENEGKEESQISRSENTISKQEIKMDVIRMVNPGGLKCEPKTWYKVNCNFCMCLENGNTLCTFFDCKS